MIEVAMRLEGIAPLLMHCERLANPMNEYSRQLKSFPRKKTPEMLQEMARIEWRGGLYERDGRVVLPADNVLASFREAARKFKLGKQASAGLFCTHLAFPLEYDGPEDINELAKDPRFFDYRSVSVQRNKIMRSRPIFPEWACNVVMTVDPDLVSSQDLLNISNTAGLQVGLCEKRPQLGRFTVEGI